MTATPYPKMRLVCKVALLRVLETNRLELRKACDSARPGAPDGFQEFLERRYRRKPAPSFSDLPACWANNSSRVLEGVASSPREESTSQEGGTETVNCISERESRGMKYEIQPPI